MKSPNNLTTSTLQTSRKCLKCSKEFDSQGPGNRICPECTREKVSLRTYRNPVFGSKRPNEDS